VLAGCNVCSFIARHDATRQVLLKWEMRWTARAVWPTVYSYHKWNFNAYLIRCLHGLPGAPAAVDTTAAPRLCEQTFYSWYDRWAIRQRFKKCSNFDNPIPTLLCIRSTVEPFAYTFNCWFTPYPAVRLCRRYCWWMDDWSSRLMRWSQIRFDFDSTAVRREFDGCSTIKGH